MTEIRPRDEHAIDMALHTPVERREAEGLAVAIARAQVKPRAPQPSDHALLDHMAALEHAQHAAVRLAPMIDRRLGVLELQRTLAGDPQARGAQVGAAGLRRARLLHPGVDQRRDLAREAGRRVEVHHCRALFCAAFGVAFGSSHGRSSSRSAKGSDTGSLIPRTGGYFVASWCATIASV